MKYDYKAVEAKWQKVWEDEKTFHVEIDHKKPKFYALVEFPYPSGAGLHVGHPRSYTALDVVSRKRRQNGYNVLYPMGWDAFGLPTENFAMKNHIHPAIVTKNNVDHFRSQLKALGFSFDWDREINTTDPEYYKWTQWIFLQLYKHGLAYKKEMNVNWCTGCKCVLANEEVVNGVCERCGSEVVHRVKSQWMLKITAYADKLIDGLDGLDYIERVATQQKNWIGRSHGAEVNFGTTAGDTLTVYTTRCDTLFGATYMVVSPEHAMVKEWLDKGILKNADAVKAYQAEAARKSDFERSELNKEKTGVKLEGVMGINPVNDTEIPIFISDYVLSTYGTGAIMAVPAHDTRDWEFAKKFGLPIIEVVKGNTPSNLDEAAFTDVATGTLVNSGFLNGLSVTDAKKKMIDWLEANGKGCDKVNYKLRDWVFSRQRYWGEPIPMVKCEKCGWQPLPESSLPLTLPDITDFEPGPDGESPLARHKDWVKTTGDGQITDADRTVIGNGYPKFTYGMNLTASWKNFDFSMNLYGVAGMDILSYSSARLTSVYAPDGGYQNVLKEYINNAWSSSNTGAKYPRITKTDYNKNMRVSDAYIQKGDYLKISNIQIGYTFPKNVLKPVKMENARVFASVDNVCTISSYNKFGDPEVGDSNVLYSGFDGGRYPFPMSVTFGLSVQF